MGWTLIHRGSYPNKRSESTATLLSQSRSLAIESETAGMKAFRLLIWQQSATLERSCFATCFTDLAGLPVGNATPRHTPTHTMHHSCFSFIPANVKISTTTRNGLYNGALSTRHAHTGTLRKTTEKARHGSPWDKEKVDRSPGGNTQQGVKGKRKRRCRS